MGADQSSTSSNRNERENKEKYSKDEVNRMLEHQRMLFDKRFKELMDQTHNSAYAQQTAREEARKEVERLIQEKREAINRQNVQTSSPAIPPRVPQRSALPQATAILHERDSAPYSFSGQDLNSGLASPSTSNVLYPNLNNEASNSSAGLSSLRNRNRAPHRNSNRTPAPVRNNNEDEELNCPTCKNRYTLTIFQCQRGHSSCVFCKNSSAPCGVCGLPITNMRNITLEAYIGERKIRCPNSDDGCSLLIKLVDMENHQKECPFREMQCPLAAIFGQCQWRGKLPQMSGHFDDVHQMHRQGNVDTEMRLLNITHDNQIVYYVVIGTFNFLFHVKVSERDGMMYMTVQLLGTQHSASKWNYEIHIYNKAEPRRKYEYSDICNSINTPIDTIFTDSNCAAIPLSYARTFLNNNFVTYKFFIKQDVEGRNNNSSNQRGRGARRRYGRKVVD
ncbi:hypothetical protein ABMA27_008494 [Loxostege sticticalis]|uniref:E3 ubiquitin-protein ligase n=1 Tax=Loxostege sticticalis TaxID=481309 RepID=A0ABR3HBJ6_LOXSC